MLVGTLTVGLLLVLPLLVSSGYIEWKSGIVNVYGGVFFNLFLDNSEDLNCQLKDLLSDNKARHKIGKVILTYLNVSA